MTYTDLYDKYCSLWHRVRRLRKSGNFIKQLISLRYRPARDKYPQLILDSIASLNEFPDLSTQGHKGLIVSLTSFPPRIDTLHLVIRSILMQDLLPEKIYLWLSKAQFPGELADLPPKLVELIPNGLEIGFFGPPDLRSHNKYYYAFKDHSDKLIVTLDDDCIYPVYTISRLYAIHKRFPDAVCSNRVRSIKFDAEGNFTSYAKWGRPNLPEPAESMDFVALGYVGVLYPPGTYGGQMLDKSLAMELAPMADDLWLKANQVANGVKVATDAGEFVSSVEIASTQTVSLRVENDGQRKNDAQWNKLDEYFGLKEKLRSQK